MPFVNAEEKETAFMEVVDLDWQILYTRIAFTAIVAAVMPVALYKSSSFFLFFFASYLKFLGIKF